MRLLEGSDLPPPEFLDGEDADKEKIQIPNPAYDVWITRDQQVVSYIVNSLSEDILSHVYGMVHAAEVWHAIHELFSSQSKSRVSACYPRAVFFSVQITGFQHPWCTHQHKET